MFDTISAHELDDCVTIDLILPNGQFATIPAEGEDSEGEPNRKKMTITVRRLSSAPSQRFVNASKNKTLVGLKRQNRAQQQMSVSAESVAEEALSLLIFSVAGWDGFVKDGVPVPCTPDKVRELMSNQAFVWIRQQVDVAAADDTLYDLGNS